MNKAMEYYKKIDVNIKYSESWTKYLHEMASFLCKSNNGSMSVKLNLDCATFYKNSGDIEEAITYSNCAICNRIENCVAGEGYIFDALEKELKSNIVKFERVYEELQKKELSIKELQKSEVSNRLKNKKETILEGLFYAYILRCKNQISSNEVNYSILEESIHEAERIKIELSKVWGEDSKMNNIARLIIHYYKAFQFRFKPYSCNSLDGIENRKNEIAKEYEEALKIINSEDNKDDGGHNVAYYCLLRLPVEKCDEMSLCIGKESLQYNSKYIEYLKNQTNKTNKCMNYWHRLALVLLTCYFCLFMFLVYQVNTHIMGGYSNIQCIKYISLLICLIFFAITLYFIFVFFNEQLDKIEREHIYSLDSNLADKIKQYKENVFSAFLALLVSSIPMLFSLTILK